ncbi:hypothetical protein, partial [Microbacterium sp. NPDC056057]|uniref:hypothetical protein n=1 Tax=Microbacterium sp. NPDC056057 TaxID=3345699 RepID=UPI0035D67D7E
ACWTASSRNRNANSVTTLSTQQVLRPPQEPKDRLARRRSLATASAHAAWCAQAVVDEETRDEGRHDLRPRLTVVVMTRAL